MVSVTGGILAPFVLALALTAGCESTHDRTASAADRLQRSADAFAAVSCYELKDGCSPDQYLPAARSFAAQAHEFRQALDSAGDRGVVSAFERLWRSYHALLNEVYGLRDRQLRAELNPTTNAFVDVQRHVKTGYAYADPALKASGGYVQDPVYNYN